MKVPKSNSYSPKLWTPHLKVQYMNAADSYLQNSRGMGSSTLMGTKLMGMAKYGHARSTVNGKLYSKSPHTRHKAIKTHLRDMHVDYIPNIPLPQNMVWWQAFIVTVTKILSSITALDMRYPFWGMAPHHWIIGNDYSLLQKKPGNSKKHHWIS
jgi:hypothetical protein